MAKRAIAEAISRNLLAQVIGRERELAALGVVAGADAPLVSFLQGPSGIGKTTLLRALEVRLAERGLPCLYLDGRDIEPTGRGLVAALTDGLGCREASLEALKAGLSEAAGPVVVLLDSWEALGLVDSALRQSLLPRLPDNLRLVLATRFAPSPPWSRAEWRGLVRTHRLGPLSEVDSTRLLAQLGVPPGEAERIVGLTGGLPLALSLAADAVAAAAALSDGRPPPEQVLAELARRFLDGIEDPALREAVEAASVVRRLTGGLLAALLPDAVPELLIAQLRALPFCSLERDGLRLHDAVRGPVADDLQAADPQRYRRYQRAAWRHLDRELGAAGRHELWRYTADLICLIGNPVWRDAFFPPGAATLSVEPARPSHAGAIRGLARRHETPAAAALVERWLAQAFHAFHVVADAEGRVVGFHCLCDAARVPDSLAREDPVVAAWRAHLAERPPEAGETALFLRRWLGEATGEAPSPVQAASWLDIKRAYLERRPSLRRVYLALEDPEPYAEAAATLGFEPLDSQTVELGGRPVRSALLDMGPGSVDGWLSRLVAAELGLPAQSLLDRPRRALRLSGALVPLTPREFEVLAHLEEQAGAVVGRDQLIAEVWGADYDGASNVVDAVVTALRRKLGDEAGLIETVRGHGYRLRGAGDA